MSRRRPLVGTSCSEPGWLFDNGTDAAPDSTGRTTAVATDGDGQDDAVLVALIERRARSWASEPGQDVRGTTRPIDQWLGSCVMTSRRCHFCGAGSLSKEHVIPGWLGRLLDAREADSAEWESHYRAQKRGQPLQERRHPSPDNLPVVVVRGVCQPCNEGWMAKLEGQAAPLMSPMIIGLEATKLSDTDQLTIATWAVKTAMALETRERAHIASAPQERSYIRRYLAPPHSYRVRIAALETIGALKLRTHTTVASSQGPVGEADADVLAATLFLGHLVVQVWGGPGADVGELTTTGTNNGAAIMVWPPVPAQAEWPPALKLTEPETEAFVRQPLPHAVGGPILEGWE